MRGTKLGIAALVFSWSGVHGAAPPGYYDAAEGLKDQDLHVALQVISSRGHRPLSYKAIWTLIKVADEDPANPDNVLTLYSRRSVPKACTEGSAPGHCSETWNREHVWAKSHGFPNARQWAHTDGHHLRAELPSCNSLRGNLDFDDGGELNTACGSKRGKSVPRTWEPPVDVKGDVARMMFYMAVRYDGDALLDQTPDLRLVKTTTRDGQPLFGKLCTLLAWHRADTVSPAEMRRNDVVAGLQGNRNPFIDRPDFAEKLWAKECSTPG